MPSADGGNRPRSLDSYRSDLAHVVTLPTETEHELAVRWRAGDARAGEQIVEASLPFVIRIAREYRRWGVPLEDLIQQGNLGLLKAAAKFEPEQGCRLVTYAVYWIRAEIRDYVVRTYRIVRLGTTRTERRAMRMYRTEGADSAEALAEASGMPLARAKKLWPILTQRDVALDDDPYERGAPFERLPAPADDPEIALARAQLSRAVRRRLEETLRALPERERRIVGERLLSDAPRTLADLGRELGVSKERVRQLEARAHERLRGALREYRPHAA